MAATACRGGARAARGGTAGGRRPGKDYLLSPMRKTELTVLDVTLDRVATAVRRILELGPAAAMNEFNRKEEKDLGNKD